MIEVLHATPELLSVVGSNLNEDDKREIEALSDLPTEIVTATHTGEWSRVATYKGDPVAAFGFSPFMGATWSAWMFGTDASWRAVPKITEEFHRYFEIITGLGCRRVEIRSIHDHHNAHSWIENSLGCTKTATFPNFGRGGETFIMFERLHNVH